MGAFVMKLLTFLSDFFFGFRPFHKVTKPRRGDPRLLQEPTLLYERCLETGRWRLAKLQYPLATKESPCETACEREAREVREALASIERADAVE